MRVFLAQSNTSKRGKLKFGDFNLPQKGANSLGSADFQKVKLYTAGNPSQNLLWLPVDSDWLAVASELQVATDSILLRTLLPKFYIYC